jgi:hypothetical protein
MGKSKILMPVLFTVLAITGCSTGSSSGDVYIDPPSPQPSINMSGVFTATGLDFTPQLTAYKFTESQVREIVTVRNMTTSEDVPYTTTIFEDPYRVAADNSPIKPPKLLRLALNFEKKEGWYHIAAKPVALDGGFTKETRQDWYTYSKPMIAAVTIMSPPKSRTDISFTEKVNLSDWDGSKVVAVVDGVESQYLPYNEDGFGITIALDSIPVESIVIKLPGTIAGTGGTTLLTAAEGTDIKVEDGYVVVDAMPDSWVMDGVFHKYFR